MKGKGGEREGRGREREGKGKENGREGKGKGGKLKTCNLPEIYLCSLFFLKGFFPRRTK